MNRQDDDYYVTPTVAGPLFAEAPLPGPFDSSQYTPTEEEAEVARHIWSRHRGRGNPISIAALQVLTGFSERAIKGIVEELVVKHRLPIGGRREEPFGYFVILDEEDQEAAARPYRAQILAMWRRLRVLDTPARLKALLDKLTLGE